MALASTVLTKPATMRLNIEASTTSTSYVDIAENNTLADVKPC